MKRIPILLLVFIVFSLPTSPWGMTAGDYEKKFDGHGKELIVDWGVFGSIEERDRLEKQLGIIWEAFEKHRDDFRLTKRIEITRSTDLLSLSDVIEKDNDLLKITLSRSGNSTIPQEKILKTVRSRPFFYYTKETVNYKKRRVVRDLGREGYYYEENGEIKYAAVDTVELFKKEEETKKYFEEKEKEEQKKIEEGF
ncbi:MAG: hypothetical protein KAJ09_03130 [Deltaproteobacteria bacterium]|nr:hypothetical protein [Deltaproteobacteria bacterium]